MHSSLAGPKQLYWSVFIARFIDRSRKINESIYVEDDHAREKGWLMNAETFMNAPKVGTKYIAVAREHLDKLPTYCGRYLIGHIEPRNLSRVNIICRTVIDLSGPGSPCQASELWTKLAWAELESEGLVHPPMESSVQN